MRKVLVFLFSLGLLAGFADYSSAQEAKEIKCSGKVIDDQGKVIAGAKVTLFNLSIVMETFDYEVKPVQEVITKADGAFSLKMVIDDNNLTNQSIVIVDKEGLALGWANWLRSKSLEVDITLGEPKILTGKIVDESGKPLSDAEVSTSFMMIQDNRQPRYMIGKAAQGLFSSRTDAEGKFTIKRVPADASAEFTVKKSGRATISTFDPTKFSGGKLQYAPGQADIKIESPVETKITGIVVEKGTDKPVAGVGLMAVKGRNQPNLGAKPVVSKDDGTFTVGSLVPGKHILQLVPTIERITDWVAEPVEVTTEPAGTKSGIKIEVTKGGLLEVVVTDAVNKKPVEKAGVSIGGEQNSQGFHVQSDKDGLAQIRLLPGEYKIQGVYKEGYSRGTQQQSVTIEDNKTTRIEIQIAGKPKVTGVVRDQAGKPVKGANVRVWPMSGRGETMSDADGKFEVNWDPRGWGGPQEEIEYYIIVRQKQRNLAAAVEIEENTKKLDVKLVDGITFVGKVVDVEGKAITGAKITVSLRAGNRSSSITDWQKGGAVTDADGKFELNAIPPEHKYSITARVEGYGKKRLEVSTDDAIDNRLDTGKFTLKTANLSVTGVVVDVDDKPVAGARIHCYGQEQPDSHNTNIQTDAAGKFIIEKVCEGKLNISVSVQGEKRLHGYTNTEGGATDVKVIVTESGSPRRSFVPKQPPSLVGKPLPGFAGLKLQVDAKQVKDKMLLVCFFDRQSRPSRHCMKMLVQQAQKLQEKGIVVIAVQASKIGQKELNDWVKKLNIQFPVGMIESNEEKTRFAWGVKALPWLILTDKQHIVQSNGFALGELDEKLKQISGN